MQQRNLPDGISPGYNDKNWQSVKIGNYNNSNLIASEGSPVRKIQEIKPVKIFRTPKGRPDC